MRWTAANRRRAPRDAMTSLPSPIVHACCWLRFDGIWTDAHRVELSALAAERTFHDLRFFAPLGPNRHRAFTSSLEVRLYPAITLNGPRLHLRADLMSPGSVRIHEQVS